jgi:hypothetical protein
LTIQKESIAQPAIKNPYQEAVNTFKDRNMRARVLQDVAMSVFEGPKVGKKTSMEMAQPAHFRDWNPDSWVARAAGVSIHYVSRNNEIRCPELNLSSTDVRGSHNMTTMTGISPAGGEGGGGVSYSGSGSGSSTGSSSSGASGGQSSGSERSGGSSSSGKIK